MGDGGGMAVQVPSPGARPSSQATRPSSVLATSTAVRCVCDLQARKLLCPPHERAQGHSERPRPGSCPFVVVQWGQNQTTADGPGFVDYLVVIDGTTQMGAFDSWLSAVTHGVAPGRVFWNQEAGYPCDQCCSGGQS